MPPTGMTSRKCSSPIPTSHVVRPFNWLLDEASGRIWHCPVRIKDAIISWFHLAAISDVAQPHWRATSMGVYRLGRDAGYAIAALLSGVVADLLGLGAAIHVVAALTLSSGLLVAAVTRETRQG
jgi:hypothetical protein